MIQELLSLERAFNCKLSPITLDSWNDYKSIPKGLRGVYIIYDADKFYYVGKGFVKDRQPHHEEKFSGVFKKARDTAGFRWLRESGVEFDVTKMRMTYIPLEQETLISAIEGSLIHMLQPIANDEVVKNSKPT